MVVGSWSTKKPAVCLPPPRAPQPPGAASFLRRPQTRPRSKSSTCSSTSAAACGGLNLPRVAGLIVRDRSTCPCRHSHSCHMCSWWRSILCNYPATKHPPLSTNRPRREAPREKKTPLRMRGAWRDGGGQGGAAALGAGPEGGETASRPLVRMLAVGLSCAVVAPASGVKSFKN